MRASLIATATSGESWGPMCLHDASSYWVRTTLDTAHGETYGIQDAGAEGYGKERFAWEIRYVRNPRDSPDSLAHIF